MKQGNGGDHSISHRGKLHVNKGHDKIDKGMQPKCHHKFFEPKPSVIPQDDAAVLTLQTTLFLMQLLRGPVQTAPVSSSTM